MGTITQKLSKLLNTKSAIKQAIIAKGQSVADTVPFADYPAKIAAIQTGIDTGDATATAADILSGKTAYAKGAKLTGTIASKGASDLTASGATVTVPAGYYTSQATKSVSTAAQATPSISVDANGKITASATQTAGYVSAGTKSATQQMTTKAAATITPSTSEQTAVASGVYTTGAIKVAAMPTAAQATPSVSVDAAGKITASATQDAGYVSAGTKSATQQLPTQAAQTITPGTEDLTIAAGKYLTGAQTIKGDANLSSENIKSGVSIFDVEGTYEEDPWTTPATLTIRFRKTMSTHYSYTIRYYDLAGMTYKTKTLYPSDSDTVIQTATGSLIAVTYQYGAEYSSGVKSIDASALVSSGVSSYVIDKSVALLQHIY